MNRKIKFRGKRTDREMWAYGYYFTTPLTAEYNIQPENGAYFDSGLSFRRHVIADENGVAFEVTPETVGQFTGLKDEKGKKIYEGDILEVADDEVFVSVEFSDGCFCTASKRNGLNCLTDSYEYCQVVGNIYDDLGLLKIKHNERIHI